MSQPIELRKANIALDLANNSMVILVGELAKFQEENAALKEQVAALTPKADESVPPSP